MAREMAENQQSGNPLERHTLSHTMIRPLCKDPFTEAGSRPNNTHSSGASIYYVMVTGWEIIKASCKILLQEIIGSSKCPASEWMEVVLKSWPRFLTMLAGLMDQHSCGPYKMETFRKVSWPQTYSR
jgi:hypothetical protein